VQRDQQVGEQLRVAFEEQQKRPAYVKMLATRSTLPAFQRRQSVLDAMESHQVVVISGATGCGKSTQVPQFCLDALLSSGWVRVYYATTNTGNLLSGDSVFVSLGCRPWRVCAHDARARGGL
jgi:pantothenate kinase-related protein Tda10